MPAHTRALKRRTPRDIGTKHTAIAVDVVVFAAAVAAVELPDAAFPENSNVGRSADDMATSKFRDGASRASGGDRDRISFTTKAGEATKRCWVSQTRHG